MSKSISTQQTKKKNQFPIQIAIPGVSNHPKLLRETTLAVLKVYHVPSTAINIFVSSKEQYDNYTKHLPRELYNKIIINTTKQNIHNFISDFYKLGTPLVVLQEAIKGFVEYDPTKPKRTQKLKSLVGLLLLGFKECEARSINLWGLYPVANGHYMRCEPSTELKLISETMWACFNLGSEYINITVSKKEDYERTIQYFKRDGKVLRLNNFAPVVQSSTKSKIQDKVITESIEYLCKTYVNYTELLLDYDGYPVGLRLVNKVK